MGASTPRGDHDDRYVVVGDPIAHSLSPRIHAAFARATGQRLDYGRERVAAGGFAAWLVAFAAAGGRGCNVTLPLKGEALAAAELVTARARIAGAANTLWRDAGGRWCADNTDGCGLVRDLSGNLGWPLAGARLLILGAGGAARGVIAPLLEAGVARIVLLNRTPARALALVQALPQAAGRLTVLAPGEPLREGADLVLNATSAGLSAGAGAGPDWPDGLFDREAGPRCYDMLYGPASEAWRAAARARGAAGVSDGLGMLVEQAAEAFWIWRGLRPDTAAVLADLRGPSG
jgi:shikimate dehydrogenase